MIWMPGLCSDLEVASAKRSAVCGLLAAFSPFNTVLGLRR